MLIDCSLVCVSSLFITTTVQGQILATQDSRKSGGFLI